MINNICGFIKTSINALISSALSGSHLLAVQTANCFLFIVLVAAVRFLGHVIKDCLIDKMQLVLLAIFVSTKIASSRHRRNRRYKKSASKT